MDKVPTTYSQSQTRGQARKGGNFGTETDCAGSGNFEQQLVKRQSVSTEDAKRLQERLRHHVPNFCGKIGKEFLQTATDLEVLHRTELIEREDN